MADANVSQLEINGTTYDICDATARDSLSQYVLKSGDTITGNLTIQTFDTSTEDATEGGYLFLKNNYIDGRMGSVQPSTAQYFNGIIVTDINGDHIRYDETAKTTTGALYRSICLRRCDTNGENPIVNGLYLHINDDGTKEIYVTDPPAWREALNVVNKAGNDFFSGETGVASTSPYISLICSTVDATLTNNGISSGIIYPAVIWKDKNSKIIGRIEETINTNGALGSYWYIRNYNTSGDLIGQKGIAMAFQKNGTFTYTIDEPSAFRKAIQMDSFWTIGRTDITISKVYGSSANITAPTVSGYTFFCWIYFSTQGWVGSVYCANIIGNSTTVWNAYSGGSGTGTVNCYALYKRN